MIIANSRQNQLQALDLWLSRCILFIIVVGLIAIIKGNYFFFFVVLAVPFLLGIPVFYLHFEYLKYNKYQSIETSFSEKKFFLKTGTQTQEHFFNEIEKIEVYATPSFYRGLTKFLFFEDYHFCIIFFKNGTEMVVTCYMVFPVSNFVNQFEGVPIMYRKIFYPCILLKKLSWQR